MSIKVIKQTRFDGGLTSNPRDTSGNKLWYTENVIIDNKISPASTLSKAVGNYAAANRIVKLLEYGTTIWGIGQDNATDKKTVLYSHEVGYSNNFTKVTPATNYTLEATDPFFLQDSGNIYFLNGTYISKYVIGGSLTYDWLSISGATLNNKLYGGVHWRGDFYGYSGAKIYKVTPAAAVTEMVTVTTGQTIKQLVPYGNFLLIICSALTGISQMYVWDGVTTTSFSDIIEIGNGTVIGGAIKDGIPHVVLLKRLYEINILRYSGNTFSVVKTYNAKPNRAGTYQYLQAMSRVKTLGDTLYFMVHGTREDGTLSTIDEAQVFVYSNNQIPQNSLYNISCPDTTITNSGTVTGIGDILLSERVNVPEKYHVIAVIDRITGEDTSQFFESTDNAYTAASVAVTPIYSGEEPHQNKQLNSVALFYDPLSTGGSVTLKYKKDEEINKAASTWTTLFADGTDYAVSHSTTKIESTGVNLPIFKEIMSRIESTGGAKVTGLKMKFETLEEENW